MSHRDQTEEAVSAAPAPSRRHVLAVGAHPDDIELGVAGTLLRHVAAGDEVTMLSMTAGELGAGSPGRRIEEARCAAAIIGARLLWGPYDDGRIPMDSDTVGFLERVIDTYRIDTMYVHSERDTHQDHVVTTQAATAAGRRLNKILRYQSPSTESFTPNVYVDISGQLERKLAALACHRSQLYGSPTVDLAVAAASATYWGAQARLGAAEAFESARFVWDVVPLDRDGHDGSRSEEVRAAGSGAGEAWGGWDVLDDLTRTAAPPAAQPSSSQPTTAGAPRS